MRTLRRIHAGPGPGAADRAVGRAHQKMEIYVGSLRRHHYIMYGLTALSCIVLVVAALMFSQTPTTVRALQRQVAELQQQARTRDTPQFPVDTVYSAAFEQAEACLSYSDQDTD